MEGLSDKSQTHSSILSLVLKCACGQHHRNHDRKILWAHTLFHSARLTKGASTSKLWFVRPLAPLLPFSPPWPAFGRCTKTVFFLLPGKHSKGLAQIAACPSARVCPPSAAFPCKPPPFPDQHKEEAMPLSGDKNNFFVCNEDRTVALNIGDSKEFAHFLA